jgi:DUF4097 and DUF4098 domain-containing protein YvlB
VKLGANGVVSVMNVSGDVTVTAASGDEVSVDTVRHMRGDNRGDAQPQIDVRPGRVDIRPDSARRGSKIDFTISVPASASVEVKTVAGDVKVIGVKGSVRASSVNGSVTTRATPQLEEAQAVSGNVDVTDAATSGDAAISSVSGSVTIKGLKARALNVSSVSGDVTVTDASCSRLTAKSVSGNIEYSGELAKGGSYDINSHSGRVRLAVPASTGFELNATTFNGSVRSEMPLTIAPEPADSVNTPDGRERHGPRRSMRATYGDRSAVLNIRTFSGDIVIAKR